MLTKTIGKGKECKNKPITENGVECECGSMLSNGQRIYCFEHTENLEQHDKHCGCGGK